MAAEQRKLLEQLMGADALDPYAVPRRQELDLYDPKICKSFLVDICVHDLFANTKSDLGPCPKLHLQQYKMEYQAQKARGKEFADIEMEHERNLERHVKEVDRQIEVGINKLKKTPEDIERLERITNDLERVNTELTLSLQEIELLGQHGEIAKALYENDRLRGLWEEKSLKEKEIRNLSEVSGYSGTQKLQVCVGCGGFLSRLDSDRRLADHFVGKMHRSNVTLRQAYEDIRNKNEQRRNRSRY